MFSMFGLNRSVNEQQMILFNVRCLTVMTVAMVAVKAVVAVLAVLAVLLMVVLTMIEENLRLSATEAFF